MRYVQDAFLTAVTLWISAERVNPSDCLFSHQHACSPLPSVCTRHRKHDTTLACSRSIQKCVQSYKPACGCQSLLFLILTADVRIPWTSGRENFSFVLQQVGHHGDTTPNTMFTFKRWLLFLIHCIGTQKHFSATGVEHVQQQVQCNQKTWLHFIFKTLTPIFLILEHLPHFRLLLKTVLLVSMQICWLNIYLLSHNRHQREVWFRFLHRDGLNKKKKKSRVLYLSSRLSAGLNP